jgi:3-methyladenine DNA glycosylase AlkD
MAEGIMSTSTTIKEIMRALAALQDPKMREANALLDQIENEMKRAPAQKQWAMNHCLAEIGIHHAKHRKRAIRIGERLKVLIDYPASPGCTPPYAPIWIAEMVRRREASGRP